MVSQLTVSSTETYPVYTILLGIGAYSSSNINLYSNSYFTEPKITDKINTIPAATLTLHNLNSSGLPDGCILKTVAPEDLKDVHIRIYKDGIQIFAGDITASEETYNSGTIKLTAAGNAEKLHQEVISETKDIDATLSSTILKENFTYSTWTWDIDVSNDFVLDWRIETGNFLSHINAICITNFWEWWIEEIDSSSGISSFVVHITSSRGTGVRKYVQFEDNAFNTSITYDQTKVVNVITVTGASAQSSDLSTQASGFFDLGSDTSGTTAEMGFVIGSESYLTEPLSSDEVGTITVSDASDYPDKGTVMIDDEEIVYTAKTDTTLTGLTRGDSPADHSPNAPVLNLTQLAVYLPSSMTGTSFWIGNELVSAMRTPGYLTSIDRGQNNSPKYAHKAGTKIFSGEYSLSNPNTNSSISLYGRADKSISVTGPTNRDTLDKYGVSLLLSSQKFTQFGSYNATLSEMQGVEVGDYLIITEYGSSSSILKRCTGLIYNDDIVEVIFGLNEEWIFNQFDDITKIRDLASTKADKASPTTITGVSDNGKAVKYTDSDGNSKWVKMV